MPTKAVPPSAVGAEIAEKIRRDSRDGEVELEPGTAGIRLRGPFIWTVRLVRPDLANGIS